MNNSPIDNPFKKDAFKTLINQLNEQHLLISDIEQLKKIRGNYTSEKQLTQKKSETIETLSLNWLKRIERYFNSVVDDDDNDSYANTSKLIVEFLYKWMEFPDELKIYSCTDPKLFNCITFSLMLCCRQELWQQVFDYIKNCEGTDEKTIVLLDWLYQVYFCEQFLTNYTYKVFKKMVELSKLDNYLKLPDSPISNVYLFLTTGKVYVENSDDREIIKGILPADFITSHVLRRYEYFLRLAYLTEYVSRTPLVNAVLKVFSNQYRIEFSLFTLKELNQFKELRTTEYKQFLELFLNLSLQDLDANKEVPQLIGMARMIRFLSPFTQDFIQLNLVNGLALATRLFQAGCFTEAYLLHDDLSAFMQSIWDSDLIKEKLMLYCLFSHLDDWLEGKSKGLNFNSTEQKLIDKFKKVKVVLDDSSQMHFYKLAKKMAELFVRSEDSKIHELCEIYHKVLYPYLKSKQKSELHTLYDGAIRSRKKPLVIDWDTPKDKKKKNHKSVQVAKQSEAVKKRTEENSNRFFNITKDLYLKRDLIAEPVLKLVDTLELAFATAKVCLCGSTVSDLLSGKKPRDYDLIVFNTSVYHLYDEVSKNQNIKCELRGIRNPILYCCIEGVEIDFTFYDSPEKSMDELLDLDSKKRDFNLGAMYCIIDKSSQLKVIGFGKTVEYYLKNTISAVNDIDKLFSEDPTRLFRLVKFLIKSPDIKLEPALQEILISLRACWSDLFKSFVAVDKGNYSRLNTALRKLFEYSSIENIKLAFCKLDSLDAFTLLPEKDMDTLFSDQKQYIGALLEPIPSTLKIMMPK